METFGWRNESDVCVCDENRFDSARSDVAATDNQDVFVLELPCEEERATCERVYGWEWHAWAR